MAPGVVVVNAATVAANLVSVSSDGSTFVFKSSAGPLSQLTPGKVMLLQDYTAAVVVSASHSGSRLTVTTRPAAMTDLFKTADISFSQPIDFANVFGDLSAGSSPSDPADRVTSLHPDLTLNGAGKPVVPAVGLSYSGKGPGDFSYGVSVFPSLSRLNWEVQGCVGTSFLSGTTCAGSSTGLSMSATLSGYIAEADLSGDFDIANGRNVRSSFSFLSTGGVSITYQILDPSKGTFKLPVLRIPMSFNVPFAVAGVPMLLKVSFRAARDRGSFEQELHGPRRREADLRWCGGRNRVRRFGFRRLEDPANRRVFRHEQAVGNPVVSSYRGRLADEGRVRTRSGRSEHPRLRRRNSRDRTENRHLGSRTAMLGFLSECLRPRLHGGPGRDLEDSFEASDALLEGLHRPAGGMLNSSRY